MLLKERKQKQWYNLKIRTLNSRWHRYAQSENGAKSPLEKLFIVLSKQNQKQQRRHKVSCSGRVCHGYHEASILIAEIFSPPSLCHHIFTSTWIKLLCEARCSAISLSAAKGAKLCSIKTSDATGTFQKALSLILSPVSSHFLLPHLHAPLYLSPFPPLSSLQPSYITSFRRVPKLPPHPHGIVSTK